MNKVKFILICCLNFHINQRRNPEKITFCTLSFPLFSANYIKLNNKELLAAVERIISFSETSAEKINTVYSFANHFINYFLFILSIISYHTKNLDTDTLQ